MNAHHFRVLRVDIIVLRSPCSQWDGTRLGAVIYAGRTAGDSSFRAGPLPPELPTRSLNGAENGLPCSSPLPFSHDAFLFLSFPFPSNLVSLATTHSARSAFVTSLLSSTNTPTFQPLRRCHCRRQGARSQWGQRWRLSQVARCL